MELGVDFVPPDDGDDDENTRSFPHKISEINEVVLSRDAIGRTEYLTSAQMVAHKCCVTRQTTTTSTVRAATVLKTINVSFYHTPAKSWSGCFIGFDPSINHSYNHPCPFTQLLAGVWHSNRIFS